MCCVISFLSTGIESLEPPNIPTERMCRGKFGSLSLVTRTFNIRNNVDEIQAVLVKKNGKQEELKSPKFTWMYQQDVLNSVDYSDMIDTVSCQLSHLPNLYQPRSKTGVQCAKNQIRIWYPYGGDDYEFIKIFRQLPGEYPGTAIEIPIKSPLIDMSTLSETGHVFRRCHRINRLDSLCYRTNGLKCNRRVSVCGKQQRKPLCICKEGYGKPSPPGTDKLDYACEDIDECATGTHTCDGVTKDCVNNEGSFRCVDKPTTTEPATTTESTTTSSTTTVSTTTLPPLPPHVGPVLPIIPSERICRQEISLTRMKVSIYVRTLDISHLSAPPRLHSYLIQTDGTEEILMQPKYTLLQDRYFSVDYSKLQRKVLCETDDLPSYFEPEFVTGIQCSRTKIRFWHPTAGNYDIVHVGLPLEYKLSSSVTPLPSVSGSANCVTIRPQSVCYRNNGDVCEAGKSECREVNSAPKCYCLDGYYTPLYTSLPGVTCAPNEFKPVSGMPLDPDDVDMHDVTIPKETVCKRGNIIVRELLFEEIEPPNSVVVSVVERDTKFTTRLRDPQTNKPTYCTKSTTLNDTAYNINDGDGAQCASDGIRFWYAIEPDMDRPDIKLWTHAIIGALKFPADKSERSVAYPLDPRGEIVLQAGCTTFEATLGNVCERYTGHTCQDNSFCRIVDSGEYNCICENGYRNSGITCVDIDECAEGTHTCDLATSTCQNIIGTFWCRSQNVTTVTPPHQRETCADGRIDISNGVDPPLCVMTDVFTPPEIVCNVNGRSHKRVLRFIKPLMDTPDFNSLARNAITVDMEMYISEKDGAYSETLACEDDQYNLRDPDLVTPVLPYTTSPQMDIVEDLSYEIDKLSGGSRVGSKCYSNGVLVWYTADLAIQRISISGPATSVMFHNIDSIKFAYAPTDPRVPKGANKCHKVGSADNCKWISGDVDQTCDIESSYCEQKHPNVYGCSCRPEYADEAGQCKINILCFDGLKLVNDTVCEDVDECEDPNVCEGLPCINTYGGYKCAPKCDNGYELDPTTRECVDINECEQDDYGGCDQQTSICSNTKGSSTCVCKPHLILDKSGTSCSPPKTEYLLLDPSRVRCCSHTHDITAFMVGATLARGVDFDDPVAHHRYSKIEPVSCVHVTTREILSPSRHAVAKPYSLTTSDNVALEKDSVMQFIRYVDNEVFKQMPSPPGLRIRLDYDDGCKQTISVRGDQSRQFAVYIVKTPATITYNDPRKTLSRRCTLLGSNPAFLQPLILNRSSTPDAISPCVGRTGEKSNAEVAAAIWNVWWMLLHVLKQC